MARCHLPPGPDTGQFECVDEPVEEFRVGEQAIFIGVAKADVPELHHGFGCCGVGLVEGAEGHHDAAFQFHVVARVEALHRNVSCGHRVRKGVQQARLAYSVAADQGMEVRGRKRVGRGLEGECVRGQKAGRWRCIRPLVGHHPFSAMAGSAHTPEVVSAGPTHQGGPENVGARDPRFGLVVDRLVGNVVQGKQDLASRVLGQQVQDLVVVVFLSQAEEYGGKRLERRRHPVVGAHEVATHADVADPKVADV